MALVFLGTLIGALSTVICLMLGTFTLAEAAVIYWLAGTAAPLLHIALTCRSVRAA